MIKLVYVLALALTGLLILLSNKYPFLALLVLLLALPIFCIAYLVLCVPFVKVKGRAADTIINEEKDGRLIFEIRSLMPIFNGELVLTAKNNLTGKARTEKIGFSAFPIVKKRLVISYEADHCGIVEISVKRLVIRDFARLFKWSKRPKISFKQYVFPNYKPIDAAAFLSKANINLDEEKFSEEKSGDDPGEIFGIREYREGDRLRQIHQKLSAKRDKLISKEYSLPIDQEATLICAPYFDSLKDTEGFYDRVYSLSRELIKSRVKHTIVFKSGEGSTEIAVGDEKDIEEMTCFLISLKPVLGATEEILGNSIYIDGRN